MIPLRYREQLPPYWYENQVAETHFVAAGGEFDYQKEKSKDIANQFLLPYATWGLDIWDWIYFGDNQLGSYAERRENIRKKNLAKAKFTISTLTALGNTVGKLRGIREDFANKEIVFEFDALQPVNAVQLSKDFAKIRPVHVKRSLTSAVNEAEVVVISASVRSFEVQYPICNMFYPEDDTEGRLFSETIVLTEAARVNTVSYPEANTFYPTPE